MIVEFDRGLQDVLPRYIRGRQEDLGYLQLALGKKDFGQIEKISKRVAGTAETYGITVLSALSKELVTEAGERHFEACEALVLKMRDFLSDVRPKFV